MGRFRLSRSQTIFEDVVEEEEGEEEQEAEAAEKKEEKEEDKAALPEAFAVHHLLIQVFPSSSPPVPAGEAGLVMMMLKSWSSRSLSRKGARNRLWRRRMWRRKRRNRMNVWKRMKSGGKG